jgi:uncharacterized protein GlcG (DUF336 family)
MTARTMMWFFALGLLTGGPVMADPLLIHTRLMSLDLARDIAWKAIEACRESGYSVSAVVVDRSGDPQVVMRDVYASRFTVDIARDKANAVILSGVSSAEFARNRADIRDEMNLVGGIMVLDGALPITAAGTLLGAIGISGSPGGDKDEACARKALDSVQARLEFAD